MCLCQYVACVCIQMLPRQGDVNFMVLLLPENGYRRESRNQSDRVGRKTSNNRSSMPTSIFLLSIWWLTVMYASRSTIPSSLNAVPKPMLGRLTCPCGGGVYDNDARSRSEFVLLLCFSISPSMLPSVESSVSPSTLPSSFPYSPNLLPTTMESLMIQYGMNET